MKLEELVSLIKNMQNPGLITETQILFSFIAYRYDLNQTTSDVTFLDFLLYLNVNGLKIAPDLDILHKSSKKNFIELTEGFLRPYPYQFQMSPHNPAFFLDKYKCRLKFPCSTFPYAMTPLHFAVVNGDYVYTQKLLNNNADVNMVMIFGSVLDLAIRNFDTHMVQLLLKDGAKIDNVSGYVYDNLHNKRPKLKGINILKLLHEAQSCSLKNFKPYLVQKIYKATKKTLPLPLVDIIASYDTRSLKKTYFKKNEEATFNIDRRSTCSIL